MYKELNVNPKERKTGDCVVRAIAKAEDRAWLEVFDDLVALARKAHTMPSNKHAYEKYLKKYKTMPVMYRLPSGKNRRYTVDDITSLVGTYIVKIAGHLTVVIDGVVYDTWDCRKKCAYKIWQVA